MERAFCIALWFLTLPALCEAEIFKCFKGGQTVYQNFPCPIDSIGSEATQTPPPSPSSAIAAPMRALGVAPAQSGEEKGLAPSEPRFGMTAAEVRSSSWGEPTTIFSAGDPDARGDVWHYGNDRRVVFNSKGRVASVVVIPP
jgi:hypothetical protein